MPAAAIAAPSRRRSRWRSPRSRESPHSGFASRSPRFIAGSGRVVDTTSALDLERQSLAGSLRSVVSVP